MSSRDWIRNALPTGSYETLARDLPASRLLSLRNPDGEDVPLIDGGAFEWVAKLTSNRRIVFVASGPGSPLVPVLFRRAGKDRRED